MLRAVRQRKTLGNGTFLAGVLAKFSSEFFEIFITDMPFPTCDGSRDAGLSGVVRGLSSRNVIHYGAGLHVCNGSLGCREKF